MILVNFKRKVLSKTGRLNMTQKTDQKYSDLICIYRGIFNQSSMLLRLV